jgi:RNA polymerase primary sigma factor
MLDYLTDREHDLIRMYFGIGMDPVDTTYISNMYGVGRERIRQMKEAAVNKLYKKFSNQLQGLI